MEITLFHTALRKVQEPILILLTAGWGILYIIDKSHTPSYISIHNLIKLRIDLLLHRKYWNCDGAGNGYHQFCGDGMVRHLAFHLFILISNIPDNIQNIIPKSLKYQILTKISFPAIHREIRRCLRLGNDCRLWREAGVR